jgi:DNA-directed RNA polymerase subunit RPC12/RpoP
VSRGRACGDLSVAAAELPLFQKTTRCSRASCLACGHHVIVKARSQQHRAPCSRKDSTLTRGKQTSSTSTSHLLDTNEWTFTASCTTNTSSGIVGGPEILSFAHFKKPTWHFVPATPLIDQFSNSKQHDPPAHAFFDDNLPSSFVRRSTSIVSWRNRTPTPIVSCLDAKEHRPFKGGMFLKLLNDLSSHEQRTLVSVAGRFRLAH